MNELNNNILVPIGNDDLIRRLKEEANRPINDLNIVKLVRLALEAAEALEAC